MKSYLLKITMVLILSVSFMSCAQNKKEEKGTMAPVQRNVVSLIKPVELSKANKDIQLIDVRTPKEYTEGHIKNAKNINFYDPSFAEEMNKLDKSKPVYIYCRSGGRSGRAAQQLKKMGFSKIYDLQGGFINWQKNNLETVK